MLWQSEVCFDPLWIFTIIVVAQSFCLVALEQDTIDVSFYSFSRFEIVTTVHSVSMQFGNPWSLSGHFGSGLRGLFSSYYGTSGVEEC